MARLNDLSFEEMTPEQRTAHDAIAAGPRGFARGPLATWVHRPGLAETAQRLGAYARYGTSLEPRLSELAIILMGRHWSAEYEWWAHKKIALEAGVDPAVVQAILERRRPDFVRDDEAVIYEVFQELHETKAISDDLYRRAFAILGKDGLVDLVGILGYYTLISMTIKVFEVDLPEGASPEL